MGEIQYQEEFVKSNVSNDAHSINYVLDQIKEVHSSDNGWVVGEPVIVPNSDGMTVTIKVQLTKYNVMNQGMRRSL